MTPVHQWLLKIRLAKAGSYHHTCKWCCLGLYLLAFKIKERYIKPVSTCHYICCSCLNLQHNGSIVLNPKIRWSSSPTNVAWPTWSRWLRSVLMDFYRCCWAPCRAQVFRDLVLMNPTRLKLAFAARCSHSRINMTQHGATGAFGFLSPTRFNFTCFKFAPSRCKRYWKSNKLQWKN